MSRRSPALFLSLILATMGFAQTSHQWSVQFGSDGEREVWVQQSGHLGEAPAAPRKVTGKALDMETSSEPGPLVVIAHDLKTGLTATKPLPEVLKAGNWKVADKDFGRAFATSVEVKSGTSLVATAVLHLKMANEAREVLVASSDKGIVTVYNLPLGDVKVEATYKLKGADTTLSAQTFTIKPDGPKQQVLSIDIPAGVETLAQDKPADTKKTPAEADKKKESTTAGAGGGIFGFLGELVSMLLGVALVAGLGYGLWWYAKNHQNEVQQAMSHAGLNTASTPDPATGVTLIQPAQPLQKIVLGGADPGPLSTAPIAPQNLAKNPRLVKEDGTAIQLVEGANLVSRESGQIVFAGESSISRHHAEVTRLGDSLSVVDLGSTNGTFVNGSKLAGKVELHPGDVVQFGAIRLRYEE